MPIREDLMDQNTPRDEATGAQPPADAGTNDASAWNQAPPQDQSQAAAGGGQVAAGGGQEAAGGGQEAAAEYAAWSADATYQQQQQQAAAQQADTQAYAAPEPQSATYSDPAAAAAQHMVRSPIPLLSASAKCFLLHSHILKSST